MREECQTEVVDLNAVKNEKLHGVHAFILDLLLVWPVTHSVPQHVMEEQSHTQPMEKHEGRSHFSSVFGSHAPQDMHENLVYKHQCTHNDKVQGTIALCPQVNVV